MRYAAKQVLVFGQQPRCEIGVVFGDVFGIVDHVGVFDGLRIGADGSEALVFPLLTGLAVQGGISFFSVYVGKLHHQPQRFVGLVRVEHSLVKELVELRFGGRGIFQHIVQQCRCQYRQAVVIEIAGVHDAHEVIQVRLAGIFSRLVAMSKGGKGPDLLENDFLVLGGDLHDCFQVKNYAGGG